MWAFYHCAGRRDGMSTPGRKRRVSDDAILQVFADADAPVLTAREVADQLPISRSGVHPRLRELADSGRLSRKEVGGRAVVWWIDKDAETAAPAAPLKRIVGMLDPEAADRSERRAREWRNRFDREMGIEDASETDTENT